LGTRWGRQHGQRFQRNPERVSNLEAIAEFKVLTSNYGAQYGPQTVSGTVEVETKSGTNGSTAALSTMVATNLLTAKVLGGGARSFCAEGFLIRSMILDIYHWRTGLHPQPLQLR